MSLSNFLSRLDFLLGSPGHGAVGAQGLFMWSHQDGFVWRQEEIFFELRESVVTVRSTIW